MHWPLRRRTFQILEVSRSGDRASRACDLALTGLVLLNVLAVTLESMATLASRYGTFFEYFELFSIAAFSLEYVLRAWSCVEGEKLRSLRPAWARLRYAVTPMALIDLLAILPFYLDAVMHLDLRVLRLLRVLRILKLAHYFTALNDLLEVMAEEMRVFGAALFIMVVLMLISASGIYIFEHDAQPVAFGSIPAAMWWAMATLTTVGYGDVTPVTAAGKVFGSCITVIGIGMAALPAGILAAGLARHFRMRTREYEEEVEIALEDGDVDASEREHLERLRRELGLSRRQAEEILEALRLESPRRRRAARACPHCGHAESEAAVPQFRT